MTTVADRVRDAVLPVLQARELELYDLELQSTLLRVIVDRPGGVDLESLGEATRAVSRALDAADPIAHRYTLEVTSPGVERPLRTPEQFGRAVGENVKVKTTVELEEGGRRVDGVLAAADADGITVTRSDGQELKLAYSDISRARTVFEWGTPQPPASASRSKKKKDRSS